LSPVFTVGAIYLVSMPSLILASASPRRRDLLTKAGYSFRVISPDVDESVIKGEDPKAYVARLALAKGKAVVAQSEEIVLAADTTVVLDGEIIGKPADNIEAKSILRKLSNRTHQVHTGFALISGSEEFCQVVTTAVTFKLLSDAEIETFLKSGEALDKAGAYSAQGGGSIFISKFEGSFTNVVGLPIDEVVQALTDLGIAGGSAKKD